MTNSKHKPVLMNQRRIQKRDQYTLTRKMAILVMEHYLTSTSPPPYPPAVKEKVKASLSIHNLKIAH